MKIGDVCEVEIEGGILRNFINDESAVANSLATHETKAHMR